MSRFCSARFCYKQIVSFMFGLYINEQPSQQGLLNTPTASLQRNKNLAHNECPRYDIKKFDGEAPVILERSEMQNTPPLLWVPGPL